MSGIYEISEYFKSFNETFEIQQRNISKNPPREVQLLRAMKAFMPEERHAGVERAIEVIMLSKTLESMRSANPSVHEDGVYDIDTNCMAGRKGMMLAAMAMMANNGLY